MKVLVTGFQPFGGESKNASYEAVKLLPDEIAGAQVAKQELPVVFDRCWAELDPIIQREHPDIVICVGQAGGRGAVTIERVAINWMDSPKFADNEGNAPDGVKICADGDDAYFASLPIGEMVRDICDQGIPAAASLSAGAYVCNNLMYHLLYDARKTGSARLGGFIHVPFETSQGIGRPASTPTMELSAISRGLQYGIEAAVKSLRG